MTDRMEEFLRSRMGRDSATLRADEDFWTRALSRGRRLRRRRRVTWLSIGAGATAALIAAVSLGGRLGPDATEPAGPTVVQEPSASADREQHDSVLLDSIELPDGRRIELLARPGGEGPCLRIVGIDERVRECGNAPSERVPPVDVPIMAEAIAQRDGASPFEIYGTTSAEVARVDVAYAAGEPRRANLLRCTDRTALDRAGISEPFGLFFAELPPDTAASTVEAAAYGSDGRPLGSTDYAAFHDQPLDALIGGASQP